ncbi:MAG: osmoprotectant transport system permease protein [Acidimicrobiaceae bacterium]|jgi:osmoprotectant transport system permease protein
MSFLSDVVTWFNDPAHWRGHTGIPNRLLEHVQYSLAAIIAAIVLAVPVAVWLGHKRRFGTVAVNVSNIGRAIPSFAILVLGTQQFGLLELPLIGSFTTFVALVALAVPPLVTNAYVAVAEVPDEVRDSARGMGMNEAEVLLKAELPMAVPLLMAGVRTASVQVVATATIAAFVGAGGLGRYIIDGRAIFDNTQIFAGATLVALLSLATEIALGGAQRALTPRGMRAGVISARAAAVAATTTTHQGKALV